MALEPADAPLLVASTLMLMLSVWILSIDFNNRAHRAFAILISLRATSIGLGVLRGAADNATDASIFQALLPYIFIPIVPATIYFLSHYPRRRGIIGKTRWGGPVLLAATIIAEIVYFVDHQLFWTVAPTPNATGLASAGFGNAYVAYGPLSLFNALIFPTLGVAALILCRDYLRMPAGSPRYSTFLIFAGFTLNALFDGTIHLSYLLLHLQDPAPYPWLPWGWATAVLPAFTILPGVLALLLVGSHARDADARTRNLQRSFLVVCLLPVAAAIWLTSLDYTSAFLGGLSGRVTLGFWRLVLPLLVTYSLLRYQLFDIDIKVKAAIRPGTVAFVFTLLFFAVGELTENLIQDSRGPSVALVAAGLITVVLKPVEERLSNRLANKLFPGVKPIERLAPKERRQLFDQQLALALQDGVVSDKERAVLKKLQERLRIPAGTAGAPRGSTA